MASKTVRLRYLAKVLLKSRIRCPKIRYSESYVAVLSIQEVFKPAKEGEVTWYSCGPSMLYLMDIADLQLYMIQVISAMRGSLEILRKLM
jgi:hypothetical protein